MPAYLLETGRSYPNPIDGQAYKTTFKRPASGRYRSHSSQPLLGTGTDYQITFEGAGPGSMPLGVDSVHYIGDQDPTCVANCGKTRKPVYRWYRGSKRDHKYTSEPEIRKQDMGCENEDWKKAASGYNKEPRSGKGVFYVMDRQVDGSVPLKVWYSYWPDNTVLTVGNATPPTVGCGQSQYLEVETLGYVFTSSSAASQYGDVVSPLYHYRYGSYSAQYGTGIDDFYTVDPAKEVNLSGGPIAPKKRMKGEYQYQGILCYLFKNTSPDAPRRRIVDIGKIGPTGQCVDKSTWYQFQPTGLFSYVSYRISSQTPGVIGFGNPDNAAVISENANFEWLYGLNGSIKGAVPRYLGFEDSYDSQFLYYLYDTSYPWNGPIFGIQYKLNNIPCCPNAQCPSPTGQGTVPCCIPSYAHYSHFYQIREDSWQTTRSRITISDVSTQGVNESFVTIDTDSPRILFRYTTRNGDFNKGDTINGWDIAKVLYYGDELACGTMDLTGTGSGFTYLQQFTSTDGGTIEVLAGYGIGNKAAFAGVYEFPKKISYYKVEINPQYLIPSRTLDTARAEAIVNNNGQITHVNVINGGRGYKNPKVTAISPRVIDSWSATDLAKTQEGALGGAKNALDALPTPEIDGAMEHTIRDAVKVQGIHDKRIKFPKDKDGDQFEIRAAKLEVAELNEEGVIMSIRVVDGGAGYRQDELPTVFVTDPDTFDYKGEDPGDMTKQSSNLQGMFGNIEGSASNSMKNIVQQAFNVIQGNIGGQVSVPDSYIRMADIGDDKTRFCQNLPSTCINIDGYTGGVISSLPDEENFKYLFANSGFAEFDRKVMTGVYDGVIKHDEYTATSTKGLYGPWGGDKCFDMAQPRLYNVQRWFDVPCAYLDIGSDGKQKAFGFMPFKYCASREMEASFTVSLEFEGSTTGPQGAAFMNYLDTFKKPKLTEKRKVSGGYRTWSCTQGSVKGRCYRDPSDSNDIIFVPVGLDENTYDYNRNGFTEYEQFKLWLGNNLTSGSLTTSGVSWQTGSTTTTNPQTGQTTTTTTSDSTSYTRFTVNCSPNPGNTNVPNSNCWDKFVRGSGNSSGPLDVYCGWDNLGNGIPGLRFWEITGPGATGTVNPFCSQCTGGLGGIIFITPTVSPPNVGLDNVNDASIAVDPQRIYTDGKWASRKVMMMGPYDGNMTVRNFLSGSVTQLSRMLRNFGNPYFDECSDTDTPYIQGNEIEDLA